MNNHYGMPMNSSPQYTNICPQCGAAMGENQSFCTHCGAQKQQPVQSTRCINCGAQVPQGMTFCSSCGGSVGNNPGGVNPAIAQFNNNLITTKKKKAENKKTLIIVAVLILVFALVGSGICFWGIPYYNYQAACNAMYNGEYDEAYSAFIELDGFMDSAVMAKESLYLKAKALLKEDKFDEAIAIFEQIEEYEDSAEMIIEAQYRKACSYQDNLNYTQAVQLFQQISYYKNSADKAKECMYAYVQDHKNNDDETTYAYLQELKSVAYKDASTIYNDLYKWKVTGIINTNPNDFSTHQSSISKYASYVHCEFEITGGTPGERINVTHTTIWPNGTAKASSWHWEDKYEGAYMGAVWDDGFYTNPQYGATGTLTIKVYNLDTGELLGTVSTRITD